MNQKIQHRNVEMVPGLKKLIDRHLQKIEKLLPTFADDALELHVTLEKLPRKNQYRTALVLTMPQNAIRVEDIQDNPTASVIQAYGELVRRIKKFKSQLNREARWQREKEETAPVSAERMVAERMVMDGEFRSTINRNLEKVDNYIRRALYHLVLTESIPSRLIEPEAIVDEVFLEVTSNSPNKPEHLSLEQWMFQVAREKLSRRMEALEDAREESHLQDNPRLESPWYDEELNFHQPDEALRLEDLLVDSKIATPEDFIAREEAEAQLNKAIANLPKEIRESFVLYALEGFSADEVAMITGASPQTVMRHVEDARKELQKLASVFQARH